eukprot:gb/GECH01014322.1/.p1 GENE.gb/GECH01014322.1/~~gb/GECH01014322.1/.p1  ORF type:complete len:274 (+),score=79.99 gb/GECH01014322.1/:1-822(+)
MRKTKYQNNTGFSNQGDELIERKIEKSNYENHDRYHHERNKMTFSPNDLNNVNFNDNLDGDGSLTFTEGYSPNEEIENNASLQSLIYKENDTTTDERNKSSDNSSSNSENAKEIDFVNNRTIDPPYDMYEDGTVTWKANQVKSTIPRSAGAGTRAPRTVGSYFVQRELEKEAQKMEREIPDPQIKMSTSQSSSKPILNRFHEKTQASRLKKKKSFDERAMRVLENQLYKEMQQEEKLQKRYEMLRQKDKKRLEERKLERQRLEMRAGLIPNTI